MVVLCFMVWCRCMIGVWVCWLMRFIIWFCGCVVCIVCNWVGWCCGLCVLWFCWLWLSCWNGWVVFGLLLVRRLICFIRCWKCCWLGLLRYLVVVWVLLVIFWCRWWCCWICCCVIFILMLWFLCGWLNFLVCICCLILFGKMNVILCCVFVMWCLCFFWGCVLFLCMWLCCFWLCWFCGIILLICWVCWLILFGLMLSFFFRLVSCRWRWCIRFLLFGSVVLFLLYWFVNWWCVSMKSGWVIIWCFFLVLIICSRCMMFLYGCIFILLFGSSCVVCLRLIVMFFLCVLKVLDRVLVLLYWVVFLGKVWICLVIDLLVFLWWCWGCCNLIWLMSSCVNVWSSCLVVVMIIFIFILVCRKWCRWLVVLFVLKVIRVWFGWLISVLVGLRCRCCCWFGGRLLMFVCC